MKCRVFGLGGVLVALSALLVGCGTPPVPIPPHRLGHGRASAHFAQATVYDPQGATLGVLRGEQARLLAATLLGGRPSPKSEASGPRYLAISYSVDFRGPGGQRWSVQMYGRAQRAVMRAEGTFTYTRQQRARILALVDPARRWRP